MTVRAAEDDDALADDPVTLTHTVSGGDYAGLAGGEVAVTVSEDETAGVTVSRTEMTVAEGGSDTYTVVLDTPPSADVTVAISGHSGSDVSPNPASLTFTPSNWSAEQTVTVRAAEDDDALADDPVTLTHTVTGGDYEGLEADRLTVTITENNTAGVTVSRTAMTVAEGGSDTYSVVLDTPPSADVTVAISGHSGSDVSPNPALLTFTPSTWSAEQTVTVSAAEDDDALTDDPVTLTHTASGGDYEGLEADSLTVTIEENDTAGVTVSRTAMTVAEGGSDTYSVVLDTPPSADVTVAISGHSGSDVSPNPASLTFTPSTWSTEQTVTVSAAEDDDALADDPVTLIHTASGGDYEGLEADSLTVTIEENDTPTVAVSDAQASEADGAVEFEVTLSIAGSNTVTVAYETSDGTAAAGNDYIATNGTLTFPAESTAGQTIRVPVTDDPEFEAEQETFTLTLSGAVNAALAGGGATLQATGTIIDDDNAAATGSPPIAGVFVVGQTITAGAGDIADANGLTNVAYAYQWVRVESDDTEAEITGATSATYVLTSSDVGKRVKVQASFTDDDGFGETLTSGPSVQVEPHPTISVEADSNSVTEGTAAVFTLSRSGTESLKLAITVSVTVSESEDMVASASEGSKTVSFSVGSASASHSVATVDDTAHEADSEVTLTVAGGSQYEVSSSDGSAKVTVTDNDNAATTGAPTISGNPWVGQTLSAVNDDVADLDGLSNATFTYQWKADGTDISGATQSEYVLQEAEQGNLITVTVSFTDDYGHDEIVTSGSVGPVIDVPGAPTLGRGEKGDSGVILRWTAPTETGGSPITGYEYEVNDDGSWVPTGSTGTTYQTSLSTFGSYTFHVRAVNAAGVGPASELFGYQSTQAVPTGAPTGLATDPGNGQVTLTWTGPDDNGGTPITHYEYEIDDSGSWVSTGSADTTYTVTNLTNGTRYSFQVRAVNGVGAGPESAPALATPATVPGAPTGLSATAGNGQVTLTWTQTTDDGGAQVLRNVITWKVGSGQYTPVKHINPGTEDIIDELTNGTEHCFKVRADNELGEGMWSDEACATPVATAPTVAPTGLGATPGNGQVTLSWNAPSDDGGSPITNYEYEVDASGNWVSTNSATTSTTVPSLTNGTQYSFRVRAVNAVGAGPESASVNATPVTVPGAPTGLGAQRGDGQVALTWTAPLDKGGSAITRYEYRRKDGNGSYGNWTGVGNVTDYDVTGLTNGTEYTFQVRAVTDVGEGPGSNEASATPNGRPVFGSAPSLNVDENTAGGVNIGSPVTATDNDAGDTLSYALEGTDAASFTIDASTGQISAASEGGYDYEANKNSYSVTVRATDRFEASDTVDVTINVDDVDEPPVAPTVSATAGSGTSLDVSWSAPGNAGRPAITGYDLRYRAGSSGSWTDGPQNESGLSATISGLSSGTGYQVQVRAKNDEGDGAWSSSGSGTTANNAPAFADAEVTRNLEETIGDGTLSAAAGVGAALPAATDADGDSLTYSLSGSDKFTLGADRIIRTVAGQGYDHEAASSYMLTLTANDGKGETGTLSVRVSVTDVAEPPDAPGAPTVTSAGLTGIQVTWTAPGNAGRPAITDYDVQYRLASDTTGSYTDAQYDGTTTTTTITGLTEDTEYDVQVRASNDEGTGDWSPTGSGGTGANTPATGAPAITGTTHVGETLTAGAGGIADADGLGAFSYQWNADGTDISGAASSTYTLTDGEQGKMITVTVSFTDGGGTSESRTSASVGPVLDAPGAPTGLSAAAGSGQVTLSWTVLSDDGGSDITGYNIQQDRSWDTALITGTSHTVTGLTNGQSYTFRVRAVNAVGAGAESGSVSATPQNGAPSFADSSYARSVEENSSGGTAVGAPVTATDPESDTLSYSLSGTDSNLFNVDANGQIRTASGTSLDHEATASYTLTITASDGNGNSDTAAVNISVTDVAEPPVAPVAPAVTADGLTGIQVTWSAPGNAGRPDITDYDVQYRLASDTTGSYTDAQYDGTATTTTITGLTEDTEYAVQVRASNDEGTGAWSQTGSGSTGANTPATGAPAITGTTHVGQTLTAGTSGIADADGLGAFSYQWKADGTAISGAASSTYTLTSGEQGKMITVTVSFTDDAGTSESLTSASVGPVLDVPGAPTGLSAATGSGEATLSWIAPTDTDGSTVTGYNIQQDGTWGTTLITSTSHTVTGLTNGQSYTFRVRVVNAVGAGAESDSVSATPQNRAPTFAQQGYTRSVEENSGSGTAVGSLVTATDPEGDALSYALSGTGSNLFTINANGQIRTASGTSLDHEATASYRLTVTASDGNGNSATATVNIGVSDVAEPPAAPGAPTVTSAGLTGVQVTWTATGNAGRPDITDYDVQYRLASDTTGSYTDAQYDGTATTTTITGLTEDTEYAVQVRASNDEGTGAWSQTGSGSTGANTPATGAPAITGTTHVGQTLTAGTSGIADADGLGAFSYQWKADGTAISGAASSTYTLTSGEQGKMITVTVSFTDDAGTSESLTSASVGPVLDVPGAPTGLSAATGSGEATLSWIAPTDTDGSTVTGYNIQQDGTWGTTLITSTSHTVTGLTNGQSYTFRVRAVNAVGAGAESDSVSATPQNRAPTFAQQGYTRSVEENSGSGTAVGSPVTATDPEGDTLSYALSGTGSDLFTINAGGQISTASGASLDHETTASYTLTITASDGNGNSATAAVTVSVTDAAEPPVAPVAPVVTSNGLTGVQVTWTAPGNAGRPDITDYDVQYRKQGASSWSDASHTGTGTSASITGLEPGTIYSVQVRATNPEGTSGWSPTGSGGTGANTPATGAPTITGTTHVGETLAAGAGGIADVDGLGAFSYQWKADGTAISGAASFTYTLTSGEQGKTITVTVSFTDGGGTLESRTSASVGPVLDVPGAPTGLSATAGSGEVTLSWTAPTDTGGSTVTGYNIQQDGTWGTTLITSTSHTVTGLTNGQSYTFRVRAVNAVGAGAESGSVSATPQNGAPSFADSSYARSVDENSSGGTAGGTAVGAPVTATDPESDTLSYSLSGTDSNLFNVDANGQIRTASGTSLDHEATASYTLTITASDGNGNSDTAAVNISVTDVAEPPDAPGAPTVTSNGLTGVQVTWSAPGNAGRPDITDYDVQYRLASDTTGSYTDAQYNGTATTTTITGLTEDTEYEAQVRATNDEGTGAWSQTGSGSTGANAPATGAPPITGTTHVGETLAAGTSGIADADGLGAFSYQWKADGTAIPGAVSATYTLTNGEQGKMITVTVSFTDDAGTSESLTSASAGPVLDVPGAPTGLSAAAGSGEVTLSWTAPTDTGGSTVTGYNIQQDGTWGTTLITSTGHTVTNLTNGQTYSFKVRAVNAVRAGAESDSVSVTPQNGAPTFAQAQYPRSVEENSAGGTAVGAPVTATDPESDTLSYALSGADSNLFDVDSGGQIRTASGTSLDHETTANYTLTITASDGSGGSATATVNISVDDVAEPPVAPGAPTVTADGQTGVQVTWTAPGNTSRPDITDYDVQYRLASDTTGSYTDAQYDGTTTTATITGLTEDTEYDVQVRASNDEGTGDWSPTGSGSTGANTPATGAPTITGTTHVGETLTAGAGGIADADGLGAFSYQWNTDGAAIPGAVSATYTLTNGEQGKMITVTVSFTDDAGTLESLTSASAGPVLDVPGAPTGLSATAGSGEVTLSWIAPTDTGGSTVTGYNIQQDGTWGTTLITSTSHTVTNLTNGQSYSFRVRAVNVVGAGQESASVSHQNTLSAPTDAPTGLTTDPGNGQVALAWTAPSDDGGSAITHYEYEVDDSNNWVSTNSATTSTTVTGLTNGQSYSFKVRAVNGVGTGPESAPATATPSTVPGAPTGLSATAGNGQVELSWTAPSNDGGSTITHYYIEKDGTWDTTEVPETNRMVTGLTDGRSYGFRVRAMNAMGQGAASDMASATPNGNGTLKRPHGLTGRYMWDTDAQIGRLVLIIASAENQSTENLTYRIEMTAGEEATWGPYDDRDWEVLETAYPGHANPFLCPIAWRLNHRESCVIYTHGDDNPATNTPYGFRARPEVGDRVGPWEYLSLYLYDVGPEVVNDGWAGVDMMTRDDRIEMNEARDRITLEYTKPIRTLNTNGYRVHRNPRRSFDSHSEYADYFGFFIKEEDDVDHGLDNGQEVGDFDWNANLESYGEKPVRVTRSGRKVTLWLATPLSTTDEVEVASVRGAVVGTNGLPTPALNPMGEVKAHGEQPVNSPAKRPPTISGTAQVGGTLTADILGIYDSDGLTQAVFSYQWKANGSDISGATGSTYTVVASDEGKAIRVKLSFTDDAGNEETLTSAAKTINAPQQQAQSLILPGAPVIVPAAAMSVSRIYLAWTTTDPASDRYEVTWSSDGETWHLTLPPEGGDTVYSHTGLRPNTRYEYRVRGVNDDGPGEWSPTVAAITLRLPNIPATGAPTIFGTARVGMTLTADTLEIADENGLSGTKSRFEWQADGFSYQWLADGAEISGADGSSYTPVEADEGKTISVRVSFTDDAGHEEALTSVETSAVMTAREWTENWASGREPTNLRGEATDRGIVMTWDAPQDAADEVTGYQVLRWRPQLDEARGMRVYVDDKGSAATTYTDADIVDGEHH